MESTHTLQTHNVLGSISELTIVSVPMMFTNDVINYPLFWITHSNHITKQFMWMNKPFTNFIRQDGQLLQSLVQFSCSEWKHHCAKQVSLTSQNYPMQYNATPKQ